MNSRLHGPRPSAAVRGPDILGEPRQPRSHLAQLLYLLVQLRYAATDKLLRVPTGARPPGP